MTAENVTENTGAEDAGVNDAVTTEPAAEENATKDAAKAAPEEAATEDAAPEVAATKETATKETATEDAAPEVAATKETATEEAAPAEAATEETATEEVVVEDVVPKKAVIPVSRLAEGEYSWGLGRRKSSVARVRVRPGTGNILVNGRPIDEYFCTIQGRLRAKAPLVTSETESTYDVFCNVKGGGITGQADAVRLGLARALRKLNMALDEPFRDEGLLTRDARMVERKKYGRRGARRGFQFSKR